VHDIGARVSVTDVVAATEVNMNKRIITALAASTLIFAHIACAQLKAGALEVGEAEAVVKLVSIDRMGRSAVVQGPTGASFTILLPAEAQNLDQVKAGDLFRMRYIESIALELHKGGTASAAQVQTVEAAPKGATPGGKVVKARQLTATVRAIDRGARTITLVGPSEGAAVPLKVGAEVRAFDEIAIGDTITVSYTQALAIEMVRETAAGDKAR
jgi:hypothetical protein